eukprot:scaffold228_cov312-Pinguiococcus_pyrenoidosus.AAC.13
MAIGSDDLSRHDYVGEARFTVGALMGVDGGKPGYARRPLKFNNRQRGWLQVFAEESVSSSEYLEVQFRGRKLSNKDGLLGKSDPYIVAKRLREDGGWTTVWQSEVVNNNLSPTWRIARIPLRQLCAGDRMRPLRMEVWDYDRRGEHDYMGGFETSVEEILSDSSGSDPTFQVIEEEMKKKKKKYRNSGEVSVVHREILVKPSFSDYLRGGMELSMMVAIDYTASNGSVTQPTSLHYMDPSGRPNTYESAIQAVGSVIEPYDSDRQFPVYGFGGKVAGQISHCFRLASPDSIEANGVQGVLEIYKNSFSAVTLSGPTLFTGVLREAMRLAAEDQAAGEHKYTVLVILTDGVINDMRQTVDAIVEASALPLSIIIVGVGGADFSGMQGLDGDEQGLTDSNGNPAVRDIVQFVPVSKYGSSPSAYTKLQRDLLAELPSQVTKYFGCKGVMPNPGTSREEIAQQMGMELPPRQVGPPAYPGSA